MSNESLVRRVIEEKLYYHHDPHTGQYDWLKSVENIAYTLGRPDLTFSIKDAIESSFTPAALTTADIELVSNRRRSKESVPLIQAVSHNLGLTPYIWTVGDPEWRQTKFERSGVSSYVDYSRFLVSYENKKNLIGEWINAYHADPYNPTNLFVVDDKARSLDEVWHEFSGPASAKNINLHPFHLKLSDRHANPTAFFEWLKQNISAQAITEIFMDMDGVVIDTDRIMNQVAIANIARLL